MTTNIIKCQLLAKEKDILGYCTLVFKNLEDNITFGHCYLMCTVFPNWQSIIPTIGEQGFLMYDEITGGIDTYYDRTTDSIVKYNFSNLVFKKFVKEQDNILKEDIII